MVLAAKASQPIPNMVGRVSAPAHPIGNRKESIRSFTDDTDFSNDESGKPEGRKSTPPSRQALQESPLLCGRGFQPREPHHNKSAAVGSGDPGQPKPAGAGAPAAATAAAPPRKLLSPSSTKSNTFASPRTSQTANASHSNKPLAFTLHSRCHRAQGKPS